MKRALLISAMLLIAMPVAAQLGGGPPIPGPLFTAPHAFDLPVASDGTVFVTRNVPGGGVDLAAVRPSGAVAWTYRIQLPLAQIVVNDTSVLITWRENAGVPRNPEFKTHAVALSLVSGAVLGKSDFDGDVPNVVAYRDGFYALLLSPNGPGPKPGSTLLSESLVSIDNNGAVRWTLPLT